MQTGVQIAARSGTRRACVRLSTHKQEAFAQWSRKTLVHQQAASIRTPTLPGRLTTLALAARLAGAVRLAEAEAAPAAEAEAEAPAAEVEAVAPAAAEEPARLAAAEAPRVDRHAVHLAARRKLDASFVAKLVRYID